MSQAFSIAPRHLGIIMDGNGRWAKARGMARSEGHRQGVNTVRSVVKAAVDQGIDFLSLYTFSTENWKRTRDEVGFLMQLIVTHLSSEFNFYRENGIRVVHSGDREGLPPEVLHELDAVASSTAGFDRMVVNLAINYGGRDELVRAARKAASDGASISAESIASRLDVPFLPDLDLIIRTGGELRLSNFMIWQSAYAEFWFSDKLWPDFLPEDLAEAIATFGKRDRRYGSA